MIAKIINLLDLKVPSRDLASPDTSVVIRAIMSSWLPVSSAVLGNRQLVICSENIMLN